MTSFEDKPSHSNNVVTLWYRYAIDVLFQSFPWLLSMGSRLRVFIRSPELLCGATSYGPEVDVWSAGCIFLEIMTKRNPFPGHNETNMLEVIVLPPRSLRLLTGPRS